jgi:hypothetical protein
MRGRGTCAAPWTVTPRGREGCEAGWKTEYWAIVDADCGFAQGAMYQRQHPTVMWAKFAALVEGAKLASERLWRA